MVHGDVEIDLVFSVAEEYSVKIDFCTFSDQVHGQRNAGGNTRKDNDCQFKLRSRLGRVAPRRDSSPVAPEHAEPPDRLSCLNHLAATEWSGYIITVVCLVSVHRRIIRCSLPVLRQPE